MERRERAQHKLATRLYAISKPIAHELEVDLLKVCGEKLENALFNYFRDHCVHDEPRLDRRIAIYNDLVVHLHTELGKQLPILHLDLFHMFVHEVCMIYQIPELKRVGLSTCAHINPLALLVLFNVPSTARFQKVNLKIQKETKLLQNLTLYEVTSLSDAEADIECRDCKKNNGRKLKIQDRGLDEGCSVYIACGDCGAFYRYSRG